MNEPQIVTVAEQKARRAELVKQREAIDYEIGTIDIRLKLGMSREEVRDFWENMQPQEPETAPPQKKYYVWPGVVILALPIAGLCFIVWVFGAKILGL